MSPAARRCSHHAYSSRRIRQSSRYGQRSSKRSASPAYGDVWHRSRTSSVSILTPQPPGCVGRTRWCRRCMAHSVLMTGRADLPGTARPAVAGLAEYWHPTLVRSIGTAQAAARLEVEPGRAAGSRGGLHDANVEPDRHWLTGAFYAKRRASNEPANHRRTSPVGYGEPRGGFRVPDANHGATSSPRHSKGADIRGATKRGAPARTPAD